MSGNGVESLLRGLARDLPPVRRIPSLRAALFAAGLAFAAGVVLQQALGFPGPRLAAALWRRPEMASMLVGLLALGAGGLAAGLAGAVPGRAAAARAGAALAALGVALCLSGGALALATGIVPAGPLPLGSSLQCMLRAGALALPPALLAGAFLLRGVPHRRLLCSAASLAGAVGLGALVVHVSCAESDPRHLLLGHALAPLFATAAGSLPALALLALLSRREA